jgi:hypothetical protein
VGSAAVYLTVTVNDIVCTQPKGFSYAPQQLGVCFTKVLLCRNMLSSVHVYMVIPVCQCVALLAPKVCSGFGFKLLNSWETCS